MNLRAPYAVGIDAYGMRLGILGEQCAHELHVFEGVETGECRGGAVQSFAPEAELARGPQFENNLTGTPDLANGESVIAMWAGIDRAHRRPIRGIRERAVRATAGGDTIFD